LTHSNENQDHQIIETEYIPKKEAKNRLRRRVLESWGWSCAYCGVMLEERGATLDHIVPKAKGGLTVRENLVGCCLGCNSSKAHIPWKTWFRGQDFWTDYRERWIENWVDGY